MPNPKSRRTAHRNFATAILTTAMSLVAFGAPLVLQLTPGGHSLLFAAQPDRWAAVKAQMDAGSARFQSAQADMRQEMFTKAVSDTETQTGQIYFLRKNGATQMGMKLLPPDAAPGAAPSQVVEFKDNKLRVYTPPNHVDEFNATGKNQATAESILTVGFGGRGSDMEENWIVTDQGAEQMSDGSKTVPVQKLDLVSRNDAIKNNYSHVTIWVDAARDVSLKQTLYEASGGTSTGDTRTVYFTNIRMNGSVDTGAFAIKCKGSCTVVPH